jgi:hypothetical protein
MTPKPAETDETLLTMMSGLPLDKSLFRIEPHMNEINAEIAPLDRLEEARRGRTE